MTFRKFLLLLQWIDKEIKKQVFMNCNTKESCLAFTSLEEWMDWLKHDVDQLLSQENLILQNINSNGSSSSDSNSSHCSQSQSTTKIVSQQQVSEQPVDIYSLYQPHLAIHSPLYTTAVVPNSTSCGKDEISSSNSSAEIQTWCTPNNSLTIYKPLISTFRIAKPEQLKLCSKCQATSTPLWRKGLNNETLCNKCGLRLKRRLRRENNGPNYE